MNRHVVIRRRGVARSSVLAIALGGVHAPVLAQSTGAAAQGVPPESAGLEEIVVTAQKRGENLQAVPITVNAVTAAQVEAMGIRTTDQLMTATPGLIFTKQPAGPQIFLRGVGTKGTQTGEEGANAVYVDGVYQGNLPGAIFDLSNIERVEVLKGPQGTLFGRNATGGAINVITADPPSSAAFDGRIGYGNYETVELLAHAAGPLSESVAADASVLDRKQNEGWGTDLTTGEEIYKDDEFYARSKFLLELGDSTHLRLSMSASHVNDSTRGAFLPIPGAVTVGGGVHRGGFFDAVSNFQPDTKVARYDGSATLNQKFSGFELVNITSYADTKLHFTLDQDGSPTAVVDATLDSRDKQFTNELQIQSLPSSDIKWIAGAFYLHATAATVPLRLAGLSQGAALFTNRFVTQTTDSIAGYAQVTAPVTDSTNVTGGIRYTQDQRKLEARDETAIGSLIYPTIERKYPKPTYRAAIDQKLGEDILGYVSYNRGFKSGGFSLFAPANPPVKPETIDAYEVGIKSEFLHHRLRVNTSAFRYDYKDVQLARQVLGTGSILTNAASARINGVDVEIVAVPAHGLTLRASAEYLDAKYLSFPGAAFTTPIVDVNGNPTGGDRSVIGDAAGKRMILAPKWTISLSADYAWATRIGDFSVSANEYYNDGYPYEPDGRLVQAAYSLGGAQLKWNTTNERYGARLWATNLFNKEYTVFQNSSAGDTYTAGAPRLYGASMEFKF
jgi:iron complex outermembrane receptor protein